MKISKLNIALMQKPIIGGYGHLKKYIRPDTTIVDTFIEQKKELFLSRNPRLRMTPSAIVREKENEHIKDVLHGKKPELLGSWIYYPWLNSLVHVLAEKEFYELRTSRNNALITKTEQSEISRKIIGIAGLSVGSSIVMALALEGYRNFKIADFDTLGLSNLNRIRAGIQHLGSNKVSIVSHQLWELDPFIKINQFPVGIAGNNLEKFIISNPKLNLIIDEMDDVVMKINIRRFASKFRIPLISAADNGDSAIIDVERHDIEKNHPFFHGDLTKEEIANADKMTLPQRIKTINKMVGIRYVEDRMKDSVMKVGRKLYAWPQLGGAAQYAGGILAYVARRVLLGDKTLKSGKYDASIEAIFNKQYNSRGAIRLRELKTKRFLSVQEKTFK